MPTIVMQVIQPNWDWSPTYTGNHVRRMCIVGILQLDHMQCVWL